MADDSTKLDPRLEADRERSGAALSDAELESLFAAISAETVDRAPGPLERLRELSTRARIALGLSLGGLLGGIVLGLAGFRTDLRDVGLLMPMLLVVLAVMGCVSVVVSLRGMHHRPLGRLTWMFSGLALIGPLLLSMVPGVWPGPADATHAMPWATGCFWFGAAVAVPSAGAVVLLQRAERPAVWRVLNAAGAGGCIGFIVQQLFCPAGGVWHVLTAHGLLGLFASAIFLALVRLWPAMPRR